MLIIWLKFMMDVCQAQDDGDNNFVVVFVNDEDDDDGLFVDDADKQGSDGLARVRDAANLKHSQAVLLQLRYFFLVNC